MIHSVKVVVSSTALNLWTTAAVSLPQKAFYFRELFMAKTLRTTRINFLQRSLSERNRIAQIRLSLVICITNESDLLRNESRKLFLFKGVMWRHLFRFPFRLFQQNVPSIYWKTSRHLLPEIPLLAPPECYNCLCSLRAKNKFEILILMKKKFSAPRWDLFACLQSMEAKIPCRQAISTSAFVIKFHVPLRKNHVSAQNYFSPLFAQKKGREMRQNEIEFNFFRSLACSLWHMTSNWQSELN